MSLMEVLDGIVNFGNGTGRNIIELPVNVRRRDGKREKET
jgi:hypothetical protein